MSNENKAIPENKTTPEIGLQQEGIKFKNPLENLDRYSLDDHGVGNLFADTFADRLRFVPEAKCWYFYKNGVWKKDVGDTIAHQCASKLLLHLKGIGDARLNVFKNELSKYNKRKTMLNEAKRVNPISLSEFDTNLYLFNCKNCTLDLSGGTLKRLEHSHKDLLTRQANVIYDPDAKCPRWNQFVKEIMVKDSALERYFQKAFGYTIVGDTLKECLFLLYGPKTRNGKGTTCESIRHLMGDYGQTFSSGCLSMKNPNSNTPSPELADLAGIRFANVSEPQKGQKLNVALIKQLTGGDMLKARALYKDPFEYRPQFKLFINTNYLLEIDDDTIFSSDRLNMIPFLNHFSEENRDESLKTTFREPENASAILNWLLEGYYIFKTEGLKPPKKAAEALAEYRWESDTIALFLDQQTEKADNSIWEKTGDLFASYEKWCTLVDIEKKSLKEFVKTLRQKNLVTRHNNGGNIVRGYKLKEVEKPKDTK